MASTKITDLTPNMQLLYKKFAKAMAKAGLAFKLTCTARNINEQIALYAQGRETLEKTNSLRKKAGLPPITAVENKRKVTWTLKSKHIVDEVVTKASAFDIVLLKDGRPHWDIKVNVNKNLVPDYKEAADIGVSVGLKAGAYFKTPDFPHYEDPNS